MYIIKDTNIVIIKVYKMLQKNKTLHITSYLLCDQFFPCISTTYYSSHGPPTSYLSDYLPHSKTHYTLQFPFWCSLLIFWLMELVVHLTSQSLCWELAIIFIKYSLIYHKAVMMGLSLLSIIFYSKPTYVIKHNTLHCSIPTSWKKTTVTPQSFQNFKTFSKLRL